MPTQKASKLSPFKATVIAGRLAATITESMDTTTEDIHSMKIVSLNLNDFLGVSKGSS